MAEKIDELSKNLKQSSTWYRIFTMLVLSLLICLAVVPLIIVLALSQTALTLISGNNNQNLRYFGMEMTDYVNQVLRYITFNSDKKPYPFATQSDKARLGDNILASRQAQQSVSKRREKQARQKLYEIETAGIETRDDDARQAPLQGQAGENSEASKVSSVAGAADKNSTSTAPEQRLQDRQFEETAADSKLGEVDKTAAGHH